MLQELETIVSVCCGVISSGRGRGGGLGGHTGGWLGLAGVRWKELLVEMAAAVGEGEYDGRKVPWVSQVLTWFREVLNEA